MKRMIGILLVLAAVLALSTRFLPGAFEVTEAGEAFPITLVGSDIAYDTLTGNHNDLKALGIMDPNATVWTEPAVTKDDLGEFLGVVGWTSEEELIGCSMYRWARFPQVKEVCVLDQGGEYRLYQERGTYHAPNGTGIPVTEVEEEVLSAPGILRQDFEQPADAREVLLDISGDGAEERLAIIRKDDVVYGSSVESKDQSYWLCDPLWVVTEEKNGVCTALEFPTAAFLSALEERLALETANGQTILRLKSRMSNATSLLEAQKAAPALEAGLSYPWIIDGSAAGYLGFTADMWVMTEKTVHTVGAFSGRIGYEDGVFTLSDWELSGVPVY